MACVSYWTEFAKGHLEALSTNSEAEEHAMNLRKIFLNFESVLFMASQVAAGGLNYLFQVQASRSLETVEFGAWSHWLAQFSVACFVGVWLQALSALGDLERYFGLRKSRALFAVLSLAFCASVVMGWTPLAFFIGWMGSLLSGFWAGLQLRRQKLRILSIASLCGAGSRFVWIAFDQSEDSYYLATLVAPLVVCFVFMILSRREEPVPNSATEAVKFQMGWAAFGLAFFSAWMPQVDLLMAPKILSANELGMLAKVCLLSKGCFFVFLILAQILLSYQVQTKGARFSRSHFLILGGAGLLVSLLGAGAGQLLLWPSMWIFLNIAHATSLCLLFLGVQDLSARHHGGQVMKICLVSIVLALLGAGVQRGIEVYWGIVLIGELSALYWLVLRDLRGSITVQNTKSAEHV